MYFSQTVTSYIPFTQLPLLSLSSSYRTPSTIEVESYNNEKPQVVAAGCMGDELFLLNAATEI